MQIVPVHGNRGLRVRRLRICARHARNLGPSNQNQSQVGEDDGDAAINATNATARHNAGLQAVYTALRCSTAAQSAVKLGDKGDGSPASKAESARRHAWLNDGHIPDIYEIGPPHTIWEFKCYTPFHLTAALGNGSQRHGGAASTSDGHSFAFGNTEELLRGQVLGLAARGEADERPLDRRTGVGRIDAKPGDYADAIRKGTTVHLLVTESSGALSRCTMRMLRALAKRAGMPEGHDSTVYGAGRASPKSFLGWGVIFYPFLGSFSI